MTAETFNTSLSELLFLRPFKVFTVELQNGHLHEIDHPLAMSVRDGIAVFISPGHVPKIFDHDNVVQIIASTVAGAAP